MNKFQIIIGIIIPFLGTTLGSALVFLLKNKMSKKVEKALLGFSAGVMIYVSMAEIFQKSRDYMSASVGNTLGLWCAAAAFFGGILSDTPLISAVNDRSPAFSETSSSE